MKLCAPKQMASTLIVVQLQEKKQHLISRHRRLHLILIKKEQDVMSLSSVARQEVSASSPSPPPPP